MSNVQEENMYTERAVMDDVSIRWALRRDLPEVLEIERKSFECAWTEEEFLDQLRQRNCISLVAETNERIVGYVVYELLIARLHILNLAVAPWSRRRGIGRQIVAKLIGKLSQQRRNELVLEVRETNLAAQLFFRSMGFEATAVIHDYYDDTTEDAYQMKFRLNDEPVQWSPTNRISFGK